MFDDKNADNARTEKESGSPEVKLNLVNRAASYGISKLVDRPNIGDRRRNRRRRRGLDFDLPTGGKPGTRKPTGSRKDPDSDGWSDEGTTNPVWVGLPKAQKPQQPKDISKPKTEEQPYKFRLSSGSGTKKLSIVAEDDERVKELMSLIISDSILRKPEETINLSTEWNPNLSRADVRNRFALNQRRFVEYELKNGNKKLYLLQNSDDAESVFAYDVNSLKKSIEVLYPGGVRASLLERPYTSELSSAVAGALSAYKVIGTSRRAKETKNWEIQGIEVKKRHQRRGLGTAMMKLHRDTFPEFRLDHSPTLSEDGRGFATATPVEKLASGAKKPSWPRKPTYGAFIDGADEIFGDAKTWEELKEIYDNTEITFLDYETTGLVFDDFRKPSSNGKPVQIGLTKMKGGKVIDRLDLFMNPGEPLGEWSRNNLKGPNGERLTDEWLSQQMSISEAHKKVAEFIGDKGILGVQNASFDKDVLDDALDESSIDWKPYGYLDTKEISDMVLPKWTPESQDGPYRLVDGNKVPSNGLADITKYLGVDLGEKHHYASADAEAAGMVMSAIIDGAIKNEWSKDVLDRNKRIAKLQRDRDAFKAKVTQFEKDKAEFINNTTPKEEGRLSAGRERPIIKMTSGEAAKIKAHRQRRYKYGDKSLLHEGKEIRRDRNNWLEGMTPEQMAELLVPLSPEQQFEMWVDDFAPGARKIEQLRNAFKKYWDEFSKEHPWDKPDTSSESVLAMKNIIKDVLESNPNMRWAFETHGAPMFGIWDAEAINKWEEVPRISELMDKVTESRGYKQRVYVGGKMSPFIDLALFNPKAVIDRKTAEGKDIPLSMGQLHSVELGDSHIDDSIAGKIMHEWGHWLHFRAIRDYENKTKQANRTYYGSGIKNDPAYTAGLDIAQQYNSSETNPQLIKLHEDGVPIDADENAPRTKTSYAHINSAEMIAEAITAVLHPNRELSSNALNSKLKKDAEILLGGDGVDFRPWEEHSAKEVAIFKKQISSFAKAERRERLSSGKTDIFGLTNTKRNYPRFERPPTQGDYKKGFSPKPQILTRELNRDRMDIALDPISEFSYIDSSGKTNILFRAGGKRNTNAYEFQMPLLIAESLNFDIDEINEIFSNAASETSEKTRGRVFNLPRGKFYVNVQEMPKLEEIPYFDGKKIDSDFELEKVDTKNISKFHGLLPSNVYVSGAGIRPDDHFVEFDATTPDGEKMLKALVVKEFMNHWAIGTSRPLSRLMSVAAGQLFGGDEKVKTEDWPERQQEFAREILASMHSMSQSYFASKGITHLTLFRGILLKDDQIKELSNDENSFRISPTSTFVATKGNNLSSWTSDLSVAIQHTEDAQALSNRDLGRRVLLKQVVPVEDIVGTNLIGFGTRGESEFVATGRVRPTMVHIDDLAEDFDDFERNDDENFYARAKQLVNKLQSSNEASDREIAKTVDEFIDKQEQSVGRLSSGRVAKTKDAIGRAFKFKIRKYKDKEPSGSEKTEEISFEPDNARDFGIISPDDSVSFVKEVIEDSKRIVNVGVGRSQGEEKRLQEIYEREPTERPNEIFAKRAVSEILAELVDEDMETLLSIFHTKESIVDIFPEQYRETIRTALSAEGTSKDIPFGLSDEVSAISKEDFDKKIKEIRNGWLLALDRQPNSDKERAILLDEKAQIRELIFRLTTGSVESDDDYKFRVDPEMSGQLVPRLETEATLRLANINTVRAKLIKAMSVKAFGGDDSIRPEKRLSEMFPNLKEAIDFIDEGKFDSLSPELKIMAQVAIERMSVDMFEDSVLFDDDVAKNIERSGMPFIWPYVKMPQYHKQRMYDILTNFAGLTDDEMRMLGYYEDNNDFQNTMSSIIRAIRGSSDAFRKSNNYQIFFSVDPDETEFGKVKKFTPNGDIQLVSENTISRFENLFNIASSGEELPEPKISDINDALNKTGVWEPIEAQAHMREWEGRVQTRRVSYQIKLINELFPKDYQGPRRVRILIGEHGERGHIAYLFEDASKPSRYADGSPNLASREIAFPDKSKWRTVEIELPYGSSDRLRDAEAAAVIDEFFTKEHLRNTLSDFITGLKQSTEYFGVEEADKEIIDTEEIDVSAMGRRAVDDLVNRMTKTKEFDIRTPEGQKAIKQRLMSDVVRSWAASSNKVFLSTLVQEVAAEEFGLESDSVSLGQVLPDEFSNTPGIFGVLKEMDKSGEKLIIPDQQRRAIKSVLRAMRDATQEYFKEKGITHVTLYRGMQIKPDKLPKDVKSGNASRQTLQMRPLSSWATDLDMANRFGGGDGYSSSPGFEPRAGVIVSTVVPVEDILAIPLTGFGCLEENEVVLLGKQREGVVHLSKTTYQTSRLSGRAKGSPDWPADQSKYDISQEKLNETILEYRDLLKETKTILNSYVDEIIKEKSSVSSYEERLSSGFVDRRTRVKLDRAEIEKRSRDFIVEFDGEEDKAGVAETLRKAFGGGYTVQVDAYSDIKEGISVGRNEHGMILRAGEGFDGEGNPEPWLIDMFLDWMRLHGPSIFTKPKEGATQVALGGWRAEDGKVYLDVVDVYPETPEFIDKAVQLGLSEDQIAVTKLKKLWELIDAGLKPDEAFIMSGGRGGRTISVKTLREFSKRRKQLLERVRETGSPDVIQVGKPLRVELKNHRNMKRVRVNGNDGVNQGEFLLFDSADGLSVSAYSGEQLASLIDNPRAKTPKISDIKKLLETQQPVASIRINRGKKENVPQITYIKDKEKDIPGLFEALSQMHRQFNTNQRDKEELRISSGAMRPLHPDTSWPRPSEDGYGAMPGDPTNQVVKMVPISTVRQYLEFDRTGKDSFGDESEKIIKEIEKELRSGRGIRNALQLFTSIDDGWAYLGEGNHRLIAAERAGLTHVPVTVEIDKSNTRASDNKKKGVGAPLSLVHPKMWQREEKNDYLPGRATPGVFAELQDDEDRRLMAEWESNSNTDKWRLSSGRETSKSIPRVNTQRGRKPKRKVELADIEQIKTASQKLKQTGLNLQWFEWSGNGNKWKSPIFVISNRPTVIVEINGVNVPFYISSGRGGKKEVPAGKWYPFWGISPYRGWFNKTSENDINNYYGVEELKEVAQILNDTIKPSDVPGRDVNWNNAQRKRVSPLQDVSVRETRGRLIGKVRALDEEIKEEIRSIMHRDVNPVDLYEGYEKLAKNIANTIKRLKQGRDGSKAGYRRQKSRLEEKIVSDKKSTDSTNKRKKIRTVKLKFNDSYDGEYTVDIISSSTNRDMFELPPERDLSVYVRDSSGKNVAAMFARAGSTPGRKPEDVDKLMISDITVDEDLHRRGIGRAMLTLATRYNIDEEQIHHSNLLSPLGARFAEGTPIEKLSSGFRDGFRDFPADIKRREIGKLLSRKDTNKMSRGMRSIARDYADYRYEMSLDMADSIIRMLNALPDRRDDDEYYAELDRKYFGFE